MPCCHLIYYIIFLKRRQNVTSIKSKGLDGKKILSEILVRIKTKQKILLNTVGVFTYKEVTAYIHQGYVTHTYVIKQK